MESTSLRLPRWPRWQRWNIWRSNDLHIERSTDEVALLGATKGNNRLKSIENEHDECHCYEEISEGIDSVEERIENWVETKTSYDLQNCCCKVKIGVNVLEYCKVIDPLVYHNAEYIL